MTLWRILLAWDAIPSSPQKASQLHHFQRGSPENALSKYRDRAHRRRSTSVSDQHLHPYGFEYQDDPQHRGSRRCLCLGAAGSWIMDDSHQLQALAIKPLRRDRQSPIRNAGETVPGNWPGAIDSILVRQRVFSDVSQITIN